MQSLSLSRFRTLAIALVAILAAGCGGGGDDKPAQQAAAPTDGSNAPPTIQGTPGRAVLVGRSYSFTPLASDPDGDSVTFSVTNLPAWATFNATTGRISGMPTAADVGNYANIIVTASDGHSTAALAAFAINVTASGSGVATVSWTPPTQNTDGSALTNLAGYQVVFGQSETDLDQTVELDNPSLNSYVVDNLTSGTWYFAVVAINNKGVASVLSSVTSKTI